MYIFLFLFLGGNSSQFKRVLKIVIKNIRNRSSFLKENKKGKSSKQYTFLHNDDDMMTKSSYLQSDGSPAQVVCTIAREEEDLMLLLVPTSPPTQFAHFPPATREAQTRTRWREREVEYKENEK